MNRFHKVRLLVVAACAAFSTERAQADYEQWAYWWVGAPSTTFPHAPGPGWHMLFTQFKIPTPRGIVTSKSTMATYGG